MSIYDDLKKLDHVKNHPLIKRSENFAKDLRDRYNKYAQQVEDDISQPREDLDFSNIPERFSEEFSKEYASRKRISSQDLVREAYDVVREVLDQFDIPLRPVLSYNKVKDLRLAQDDFDKVVEANVVFNVEFKTVTGARKLATISVPVSRGSLLPPSIIDIDGIPQVIAQSTFNTLINRNTSFAKEPLKGHIFSPPLSAEERIDAVEFRNEIGYQPREYKSTDYLGRIESREKPIPAAFKAVVEDMIEAQEKGLDTFPKRWNVLYEKYILNHVSEAEKDAWMPHLINEGFCINPLDTNRGRRKAQQDTGTESAPSDVSHEFKNDTVFYANTKTPIESGDKVKFEGQEGLINGTIEGFEGDKILVKSGKGYVYKLEIRDLKPLPSTFKKMYLVGHLCEMAKKNAQAMLPNTGYSGEMANTEFEPLMDTIPDKFMETVSPGNFYKGTIMPMEFGDRVKFNSKGGPVRGVVGDVGEDEWVYIDSQDLTYRVHKEDIEPMNSTFKKMWLAPESEDEDLEEVE